MEKISGHTQVWVWRKDKITHCDILRFAQGPEAAKVYLEKNLEVDEFRPILIWEDMVYVHAECLCREQLGQEQINQPRRQALLRDRDFYQAVKGLLAEEGCWQEMYPGFLVELKAARPAYEYMEILKLEGGVPLLMEQVRLNPESVSCYGDVLVA